MMECAQPAPVPDTLIEPLEPLQLAVSWQDILKTHMVNMERTGICYARYEALVDAVESRNEVSQE